MKKTIAIIGGGPSAFMLAAKLDESKFDITIYEKNAAPGRKFLVAGNGGFNLTHSEPAQQLITRYIPAAFFEPLINSFSNIDLRNWLEKIGISTFVGSSNRVFPTKGIKPIEVLNAILNELKTKNVTLLTNYKWQGWNVNGELSFTVNQKIISIKADIILFALGGASWKITGSDGSWSEYFSDKDIAIVPFQASNCAFKVNWPKAFLLEAEGQPLKNIVAKIEDNEKAGEIIITAFGLEGGAAYALSSQVRNQLNENQTATIFLDLKPSLSVDEIIARIKTKVGKNSYSRHLENQLKLSKAQLALLKFLISKEDYIQPERLANKIKNFPVIISGMAPIDEAISTVGGLSINDIDKNFQIKKLANHYAIGEMLDWDAPTGGYLLQGCFSMGAWLAKHINQVR